MPRKGRPKNSGYRSQILIVWLLIARGGKLCFNELVEATGIHRNRVAPNAGILFRKGLISKKRVGHKMIYEITNVENAYRYVWKEFWRRVGRKGRFQIATPSSRRLPTDIEEPTSKWKALEEGANFVVDKNLGVVTLANPPKHPIRVTYRAGYVETPEPVRKASALLAAGWLNWIIALMKNDSAQIRKIPKRTRQQVCPLLRPYRTENQERLRQAILMDVAEHLAEIQQLEKAEGLPMYKDYRKLLRWGQEVRWTAEEKAKLTKPRNHGWRSLPGEGHGKSRKRAKR